MKKKNKELEYDWFGMKKPSKRKTLSYLGEAMRTKPNQNKNRPLSFLGTTNPNFKMTPSPLFKKESIKKKKLSKWGDADLDGTPNYFDCDPTNFLKDAKDKRRNIFKEKVMEVAPKIKKKLSETFERATPKLTEKRKAAERISKIKKGEERVAQRELEIKEGADILPGELEKLEKKKQVASKKRRVETSYQEFLKAARLGGPAGTVKIKELAIEEKIAAGKRPSQKQILAYERAFKKTTLGARAGRLADALKVGGVTGLATGAGLTKKGTYSKEMLARSARVRKLTKGALGQVFGPSLTSQGFSSEPRGRGRPAGPSGEYKIGGRPVYEEEYRQWEAKQNALNRMLPSEAQSQSLNPEYVAYLEAKQLEEQMQQQPQQQSPEEMMGEGMNEPVPSDQAPQTEGMTNEVVQAIEEAKKRSYTRASPEEIRQAQQAAQTQDQVLNAPNFMKGELKAAGGGILTAKGPQIMDAPNVFKGEMRNVYSDGDMPAVRLSERPMTNPYGDSYLEIEIGSGKPVVRNRIREKWVTGEAL